MIFLSPCMSLCWVLKMLSIELEKHDLGLVRDAESWALPAQVSVCIGQKSSFSNAGVTFFLVCVE